MVASAIVAGASLFGARSAKKAASAQARGFERAGELQYKQYQQTRADLAPWRKTGKVALTELADLYGLPVEGRIDDAPAGAGGPLRPRPKRTKNPMAGEGNYIAAYRGASPRDIARWEQERDAMAQPPSPVAEAGTREERQQGAMSRFFTSPGYEFRLGEGIRALERSGAARGKLNSGAMGRALVEYGQGVASQEFGSYANRLAELAGGGQTAATDTGRFGAAAAANQGQMIANAGTARASGYTGAANAITGGIRDFAYLYGSGAFNRPNEGYVPSEDRGWWR